MYTFLLSAPCGVNLLRTVTAPPKLSRLPCGFAFSSCILHLARAYPFVSKPSSAEGNSLSFILLQQLVCISAWQSDAQPRTPPDPLCLSAHSSNGKSHDFRLSVIRL